jgi:hypothetical protein
MSATRAASAAPSVPAENIPPVPDPPVPDPFQPQSHHSTPSEDPAIQDEPINFAVIFERLGDTLALSMADAIRETRASATPAAEPRDSEPKANPPAEFDGTSRRKLEAFIAENEIMFATSPRKYRLETNKVLAAGSYLKGDPKKWFSNFFLLPVQERPFWFLSWEDFKIELRRSWGLEDPEGAAEAEISRLKMIDKDHVAYFTSRFKAIQYRLPMWGDRNLRNAYYAALAPRIRTQFVTAGKVPPSTLDGLIYAAEDLDRAYWTDFEVNRSLHNVSDPKKSENPTTSSSEKKKPFIKGSTTSSKAKFTSTNPSTPTSTSPSKKPSTSSSEPAYKKHLGPDGKLNPEERQRRLDNNLCLFCGQGKHSAIDCPKRKKPGNSGSSLARATITVVPEPSAKVASVEKK